MTQHRNATSRPPVYPFVSPRGKFVFTTLASNVTDAHATVAIVGDEWQAVLSPQGRKLGYKTIEEVADSEEQAEELIEALRWSYGKVRSEAIPDDLMPAKVKEMRGAKTEVARDKMPRKAKPEVPKSGKAKG